MNHDKKVGLGLGILLVGIVGAFFFREEPHPSEPLPELQTAETRDREITDSLESRPAPDIDLEQYERRFQPAIDLQGIEIAGADEPLTDLPSTSKKVFDEEFDFLNDPAASKTAQPQGVESAKQTTPSGGEEAPVAGTPQKTLPKQDFTVSQSAPSGEPQSNPGMFRADLSNSRQPAVQPFREDRGQVTDQVRPPAEVSPMKLQEPSGSGTPRNDLKDGAEVPVKRERRVIVPRRVRLNEPIAHKSEDASEAEPTARFLISQPGTEASGDGLPTLEGLEPLDLPR